MRASMSPAPNMDTLFHLKMKSNLKDPREMNTKSLSIQGPAGELAKPDLSNTFATDLSNSVGASHKIIAAPFSAVFAG